MQAFTYHHIHSTLVCLLLVISCGRCYKYKPKQARCERIVIPLCSDIPYNYTRMPNLLGHATQQEAAAQVHEFIPLVQIGCSRLLKFFLCAEYAPMCTEQVDETLVIPPCRSMCLEVRSRCEPILQRFNFHWPTSLDCDALPERSDRIDLCIEPPGEDDRFPANDADDQSNSPHHVFRSQSAAAASAGDNNNNNGEETGGKSDWIRLVDGLNAEGSVLVRGGVGDGRVLGPVSPGDNTRTDLVSGCPDRYIPMATLEKAANNKHSASDEACVARCHHDVMFRADDKRFSNTWLITWSSISFLSSFITVLTFIIDRSRFRYPERPVVYICVCSAMHAAAYLIRFAAGRHVISCDRTGSHLVAHGDISNAWCVVIAVILYYFSVAGAIWWTVLTISWYLAAARKWGEEAIETLAKYFHMVSWSLPAVCTTVALVLRKVDADELTGLCYIGSSSATAIISPEGVAASSITVPLCFVVLPLVGCLAVGTGFVGAGFGAVRRVRYALQLRQRREAGSGVLGVVGISGVDRLERLMVKMAVYSTLYAVPIATVLGCLIYEIHGSAGWQRVARDTPCRPSTSADGLVLTVDGCRLEESIPAVEVYLVKTFASLMPGIGGGVWIWSMKTVRSWRNFCARCAVSTGGRHSGAKQMLPSTGDVRTAGANGRMVRWPGGLVTNPPSSPGGQLFTLN